MSTTTAAQPTATPASPESAASAPAASGPRALLTSLAFARSTTDRPTDVGLLVARVIVGAVFIGHGGQKLFAWWGGGGIEGTGQAFAGVGLEPGEALAVLAGAGEFFGGILLILGLLTRLGAFSVGASMVVAIIAMHLPGPFLDGYEFPLTLLGAALVFLLAGPGRLSLDAAIRSRLDRPAVDTSVRATAHAGRPTTRAAA